LLTSFVNMKWIELEEMESNPGPAVHTFTTTASLSK
jgi:hypothetical protein